MSVSNAVDLVRYWLPLGSSYSLTNEGWLAEPHRSGFFVRNSEAIPTSGLAQHRCLVMLGEPGMGKSRTVLLSHPLVEDPTEITSCRFDLGSFSSEDRLARTVFEAPEIEQWRGGSGQLCLTLDGFDEARARIETLPRLLGEYLDRWDCSRLFLRIVCRTADWPASLGSRLKQIFGVVTVVELLPLRRADARKLLEAGVQPGPSVWSPDEILGAIEAVHLVPLAARPLTLQMLRAAIGANGEFPVGSAELYERGLLALADETTQERRDTWQNRVLAEKRIEVASRLAAISVFGGRPAIWLGSASDLATAGGADVGDLLVSEVILPSNESRESSTPPTDVEFSQTVRCGLFTGAGESRVVWAHATFMDYLAARWIVEKGLTREQVRSLLVTSDNRIHVRTRQVAAWLVRTLPAGFDWLIPLDPEAFLANVDLPDDELRRQLVEAIFTMADAGNLFHDYSWNLAGLAHRSLDSQLRDRLRSVGQNEIRIAIDIAHQCNVTSIVPDLAAIASGDVHDISIRVAAAMGVYNLSINNPTNILVPLLAAADLSNAFDDESAGELEGAALLASWPHAITTAKVFAIVNPRFPRNFSGMYSLFINEFAKGICIEDLSVACEWLLGDPDRLSDSRLNPLTDSIIRLCVNSLDDPKVRDVLRMVTLHRLKEYKPLFSQDSSRGDMNLSDEQRRALSLVLLSEAIDEEIFYLIEMRSGDDSALIRGSDFEWLIGQYETALEPLRTNIGHALIHLLNPADLSHSEAVLMLSSQHPAADILAPWRGSVDLSSSAAIEARKRSHDIKARRLKRSERSPDNVDASIDERIIEAARRAENGDTQAFYIGIRLVTVRPGTNRYTDEYQPDVRLHARWATLPEETRQQFIRAAPNFLKVARCEQEAWLGQGKRSEVAEAAYRAMVLLFGEYPEALQTLNGSVWREWAPILVSWSVAINGADLNVKRKLLELAVPDARDELEASLLIIIDEAIRNSAPTFHREELSVLMSATLSNELFKRLRSSMSKMTREEILDALMGEHSRRVVQLLLEWLEDDERIEHPERARAAVLRLLMGNTRDAWRELSYLMQHDPEFFRSALEANHFYYDHRPPILAESELAELYVWVFSHFPPEEDPRHEGVHTVGPREALARWRDGLLDALSQAGTTGSIEAIEGIIEAFPQRQGLLRTLVSARRTLREKCWEPLSIAELDMLAAHPARRIIRTTADLMAVTVSALGEIQTRLQGDTQTAEFLWDTHSKRPKREETISNYLADELRRRLDQHGVVVNREVQVRPSLSASGIPERTDLRIDAIEREAGQPASPLVVPVEVKGNWNQGIVTSIRSQLVDRYMVDLHTSHGVYVVGWFDQESWTTEGDRSRKNAARRWESRQRLETALELERIEQEARGVHISMVVMDFSLRRPSA